MYGKTIGMKHRKNGKTHPGHKLHSRVPLPTISAGTFTRLIGWVFAGPSHPLVNRGYTAQQSAPLEPKAGHILQTHYQDIILVQVPVGNNKSVSCLADSGTVV